MSALLPDRNGRTYTVGCRVVSIGEVSRFPFFKFEPGVTGTITAIEEDGRALVRADEPWRSQVLEGWGDDDEIQCFSFGDYDENSFMQREWEVVP